MTPDHQAIIEVIHKTDDALMQMISTMRCIKGIDKAKLDVAEKQLLDCMVNLEEAMPK